MSDSAATRSLGVPPPLALTRVAAGLLSIAALASALGVAGIALVRGAQPYWLVVGMELCIAMAGVFGVLFLRRKFAEGPAMTLLCIAGTVFAAGFLSWLAVRGGIKLKGDQSLNLKMVMLARVAIAAALVGLASVEVLRRDRRSVGLLGRAVATGVPLAIIAAGMILGRDALAAQQAVPAWIVWTLVSIGAVIAMTLLCACGHFVIRAFEMGRLENATVTDDDTSAASQPGSAA